MKEYTLLHPLFMSFYAKSLFRDVGQNWKGVGFLYLLLLLALSWVPVAFVMQSGLTDFVKNEAPAMVEQMPAITISQGQVSIDRPEPYFIRDPDSDQPLCIIDTTGQHVSLDNTPAFALLTQSALIVRKSALETRTIDLSQIEQFSIDGEFINGWLEFAENWFVLLLYPILLLGSYVYRIVQVLIYGAIGLLFARGQNVSLGYAALVRLAVIAITPVVIVDTLLGLLSVQIPVWWLICLLAALGYLYFAIMANAEGEHEDRTRADAGARDLSLE